MTVGAHDDCRLLHGGTETAGVLSLAQDGFVCSENESRVLADFDEVGPGGDGGNGRVFDRSMMQDAAHLHVVGDDEAAEAELMPSVRSIQKGEMDAGSGLASGLLKARG